MDFAFLLFDGVTALDAVGPYEVLSRIPGARVRFVARTAGTVGTANGMLGLRATEALADVVRPDVVVVPGGPCVDAVAADETILAWLRAVHATTRWTASVCSGALVLGAAGLLRGVRATTHARALEDLARHGATVVRERYVLDGRIATSAGVTAGIDLALALAERLAGADVARGIRTVLEVDATGPSLPAAGPGAGAHRLTARVLRDETVLRRMLGEPNDVVRGKVDTRITPLTRLYVERSPFVLLATSDPRGRCDASPRGDPPGFVRVLDERTLLLPDRPGNRLADSLRNVVANPRVGLLFLVPGVVDTFRVNGRATITDDPALLEGCAVEGRVPRLGILVDVEEAFMQCGKALYRSHLWDPARHRAASEFPTSGAIHAERIGCGFDAAAYDAARDARYRRREGFY
ncbi:MAG: DJ-1/PfpI family protein [Planctomycetes bacterium]|nr:DJ-1/PfpI family protein [Planctomycetota bacterium]